MGDVGRFDAEGRLWFLGRKSQRVRTAEGDLYADQCEGVFGALAGIEGTALVGAMVAGRQVPVLCVAPGSLSRPRSEEELRSMLLEAGSAVPCTRAIRTFLFHGGPFPVDTRHNAKIQRERLAAWAAKRLR
jgi:acyl-CoA synthetase (AMP-forming)/AMP-acid ligase II